MIFEIETILSQRFISLNPLLIDEYRAVDVFKMIKNLNTYLEHAQHSKNSKNKGIQSQTKKYGQIATSKKKQRYTIKITD